MIEFTIPRLAGTRDAVRTLVDAAWGGDAGRGVSAAVVCRDVVSISPSFADELVHQVLQDRQASELVLVSPPSQVLERVGAAAVRRGLAGRVRVATARSVFA